MEILKRLEAKYRPVVNQAPAEDLEPLVSPVATQEVARSTRLPLQASLF
jgi:hypothetical protein